MCDTAVHTFYAWYRCAEPTLWQGSTRIGPTPTPRQKGPQTAYKRIHQDNQLIHLFPAYFPHSRIINAYAWNNHLKTTTH